MIDPIKVLETQDSEFTGVTVPVDDLTKYKAACSEAAFTLEHVNFLKRYGVKEVTLGMWDDGQGYGSLAFSALIQLECLDDNDDPEDFSGPGWDFGELAELRPEVHSPGWTIYESE